MNINFWVWLVFTDSRTAQPLLRVLGKRYLNRLIYLGPQSPRAFSNAQ